MITDGPLVRDAKWRLKGRKGSTVDVPVSELKYLRLRRHGRSGNRPWWRRRLLLRDRSRAAAHDRQTVCGKGRADQQDNGINRKEVANEARRSGKQSLDCFNETRGSWDKADKVDEQR